MEGRGPKQQLTRMSLLRDPRSSLLAWRLLARHAAKGHARRAGRRTLQTAVGHRPRHGWGDGDRSELDPLRPAARAAAATHAGRVDLVAVVLVVGDPVNVIERAIVARQGIVVIVPEALQTLFLAGQPMGAVGEDVPPGLIAAVVEGAPPSPGGLAAQAQTEHGANHLRGE